jgi:hypothetical protein
MVSVLFFLNVVQCGVPKKGHVCPYQPKLTRKVGEPLPEMRSAAIQVEMDEVSWDCFQADGSKTTKYDMDSDRFLPSFLSCPPVLFVPKKVHDTATIESEDSRVSRIICK